MRVIISLLLVAVVLQSAFAVTSKANQAKFMIEKINNKLQKSNLGRALKNMITLSSKLGYNYDDLFEAFDTLKDSLLGRKQEEEDLYAFQTQIHESNVQSLESDISQFTNDILSHEAQLSAQQETLATQEQTLADHQTELAIDQAQREFFVQQLALLEEGYAYEIQEYNDAKDIIHRAIEALRDADSHGWQSFAQVESKTGTFAKKLSEVTAKLSSKHQLFIQPVVQVLSQVKQSSIQDAIKALSELLSYFDTAVSDLTNIYINFKNYFETSIAQLTQAINILIDVVIPEDESQIANTRVAIQQTEDNLVVDHANLDQAVADLAAEHEQFDRTTERHNALIDRINSEYDLVVSAERIIRDAQANQEA